MINHWLLLTTNKYPMGNTFSLHNIYFQPPIEPLLSIRSRQMDKLFNEIQKINTEWKISEKHRRLGYKDININYIWIVSNDNKYVLQIVQHGIPKVNYFLATLQGVDRNDDLDENDDLGENADLNGNCYYINDVWEFHIGCNNGIIDVLNLLEKINIGNLLKYKVL